GQFIDVSSDSAGQPMGRTASSRTEVTPIPSAKKTLTQTQAVARPFSPGMFSGFGHSFASGEFESVNTQVTDKGSAKTVPVLQLAKASPSSRSTSAAQSAVAREARKIISGVESEVQNFIPSYPKDTIDPDFVLTALNKAYQSASSKLLKQALLADP